MARESIFGRDIGEVDIEGLLQNTRPDDNEEQRKIKAKALASYNATIEAGRKQDEPNGIWENLQALLGMGRFSAEEKRHRAGERSKDYSEFYEVVKAQLEEANPEQTRKAKATADMAKASSRNPHQLLLNIVSGGNPKIAAAAFTPITDTQARERIRAFYEKYSRRGLDTAFQYTSEMSVNRDFYKLVCEERAKIGAPVMSKEDFRRVLFTPEVNGRLEGYQDGISIRNLAQKAQKDHAHYVDDLFKVLVNAGDVSDINNRASVLIGVHGIAFGLEGAFSKGRSTDAAIFSVSSKDVADKLGVCFDLGDEQDALKDAKAALANAKTAHDKKAFESVAEAAQQRIKLKQIKLSGFDSERAFYDRTNTVQNTKIEAGLQLEEANAIARQAMILRIAKMGREASGTGFAGFAQMIAEKVYKTDEVNKSRLNTVLGEVFGQFGEYAMAAQLEIGKLGKQSVNAVLFQNQNGTDAAVTVLAAVLKANGGTILPQHKVNMAELLKLNPDKPGIDIDIYNALRKSGRKAGAGDDAYVAAQVDVPDYQIAAVKRALKSSAIGKMKDKFSPWGGGDKLVAEVMIDSLGTMDPALSTKARDLVVLAMTRDFNGGAAKLKQLAGEYSRLKGNSPEEQVLKLMSEVALAPDAGEDVAGMMLAVAGMGVKANAVLKDRTAIQLMQDSTKIDQALEGIKVEPKDRQELESVIKAMVEAEDGRAAQVLGIVEGTGVVKDREMQLLQELVESGIHPEKAARDATRAVSATKGMSHEDAAMHAVKVIFKGLGNVKGVTGELTSKDEGQLTFLARAVRHNTPFNEQVRSAFRTRGATGAQLKAIEAAWDKIIKLSIGKKLDDTDLAGKERDTAIADLVLKGLLPGLSDEVRGTVAKAASGADVVKGAGADAAAADGASLRASNEGRAVSAAVAGWNAKFDKVVARLGGGEKVRDVTAALKKGMEESAPEAQRIGQVDFNILDAVQQVISESLNPERINDRGAPLLDTTEADKAIRKVVGACSDGGGSSALLYRSLIKLVKDVDEVSRPEFAPKKGTPKNVQEALEVFKNSLEKEPWFKISEFARIFHGQVNKIEVGLKSEEKSPSVGGAIAEFNQHMKIMEGKDETLERKNCAVALKEAQRRGDYNEVYAILEDMKEDHDNTSIRMDSRKLKTILAPVPGFAAKLQEERGQAAQEVLDPASKQKQDGV